MKEGRREGYSGKKYNQSDFVGRLVQCENESFSVTGCNGRVNWGTTPEVSGDVKLTSDKVLSHRSVETIFWWVGFLGEVSTQTQYKNPETTSTREKMFTERLVKMHGVCIIKFQIEFTLDKEFRKALGEKQGQFCINRYLNTYIDMDYIINIKRQQNQGRGEQGPVTWCRRNFRCRPRENPDCVSSTRHLQ